MCQCIDGMGFCGIELLFIQFYTAKLGELGSFSFTGISTVYEKR